MTVVPTQTDIPAQDARWRMIQWSLLIGSILLTVPGMVFRLWNITADPRLESGQVAPLSQLARQMQTEPSAWSVLRKVGHRPCRIDECNVTHSQFRDPIVLNHR